MSRTGMEEHTYYGVTVNGHLDPYLHASYYEAQEAIPAAMERFMAVMDEFEPRDGFKAHVVDLSIKEDDYEVEKPGSANPSPHQYTQEQWAQFAPDEDEYETVVKPGFEIERVSRGRKARPARLAYETHTQGGETSAQGEEDDYSPHNTINS